MDAAKLVQQLVHGLGQLGNRDGWHGAGKQACCRREQFVWIIIYLLLFELGQLAYYLSWGCMALATGCRQDISGIS